MAFNASTLFTALEIALMVVGLVLASRYQFAKSAAEQRKCRLGRWNISGFGLLVIAFQAIVGGIIGLSLGGLVNSWLPSGISTDTAVTLMVANSGLHLGILAGIAFGWRAPETLNAWRPGRVPASATAQTAGAEFSQTPTRVFSSSAASSSLATPLPLVSAIKFGVITYLAALPLVTIASLLWQGGLDLFGIPRPKQELIDLFGHAHGFWKIFLLALMAVVVAPITEELVFRAGIFRFVRTRLPRVFAFALPSALFACAHINMSASVPLFVLALILSLAYERSGRVVTTIVAHGLFNLTSVVLLLAGVDR